MADNSTYPLVIVTTLNWNNGSDLIECVESLTKLSYPNYRILVVDNGSSDGSVAALRDRFPQAEIIENGRNLGYADGANIGLRHACHLGAAYTLVINSDTVTDPEALTALVRTAEEDDRIGLVTGKVYWYSRPDTLQTAGRESDPTFLQGPHVGSGQVDHGQWDQVRDFDYVDDVFLLVRREVFEQVGGYSPIFPVYWGISDLCARVRRAGFRIVYTPGSKVWHKGVIGNENVVLSPHRIFYIQYHQVPFMWRNASKEQWAAYLRRTLMSLPLQSLRYVRHARFAALWAHVKGLGCGLLWVSRNQRQVSA